MTAHANAALAASNLTADIAARIHAIGFDALDGAVVAAVREVIADGAGRIRTRRSGECGRRANCDCLRQGH